MELLEKWRQEWEKLPVDAPHAWWHWDIAGQDGCVPKDAGFKMNISRARFCRRNWNSTASSWTFSNVPRATKGSYWCPCSLWMIGSPLSSPPSHVYPPISTIFCLSWFLTALVIPQGTKEERLRAWGTFWGKHLGFPGVGREVLQHEWKWEGLGNLRFLFGISEISRGFVSFFTRGMFN